MFNIICDKCGGSMAVDQKITLDNYVAKVDYIRDGLDKICDIALNSYLTYRCTSCLYQTNYTMAEVELKLREDLTLEVKKYRKNHVFRNVINPLYIDQDSGLEFCGRCLGVDDEGNCYIDVIKQCPFRR
jgi:predicted nucleic-acid-binding Zn-ribbon protein